MDKNGMAAFFGFLHLSLTKPGGEALPNARESWACEKELILPML